MNRAQEFEKLHGKTLVSPEGTCWYKATISSDGKTCRGIDAKDGHTVYWGATLSWRWWVLDQLAKGKLHIEGADCVSEGERIARATKEQEEAQA